MLDIVAKTQVMNNEQLNQIQSNFYNLNLYYLDYSITEDKFLQEVLLLLLEVSIS